MRPVEDVKKEIETFDFKSNWGIDRIVKTLPDVLYENEMIKALATGNKSGGMITGSGDILLICTSQRILLIEKKLLTSKTDEIPLDQVASVERKDGMVLSKVTILTSGKKKIHLKDMDKSEAQYFCRAVQQAKSILNQPDSNIASSVVQEPSMADQLRDLKELVDQGIITAEEFELKKKQILNV